MAEGLRLRLEFEGRVGSAASAHVFVRQWFQPHAQCKTIADVTKQVIKEFRLQTPDVSLSLRGFAMAPSSPVTLLRDGDIIVVSACNSLELTGTSLDLRLASAATPDHSIQPLQQRAAYQMRGNALALTGNQQTAQHEQQGNALALAGSRADPASIYGQAGRPKASAQADGQVQRADDKAAISKQDEATKPPKGAKRKAEAGILPAEDSTRKRRIKKAKEGKEKGKRGVEEEGGKNKLPHEAKADDKSDIEEVAFTQQAATDVPELKAKKAKLIMASKAQSHDAERTDRPRGQSGSTDGSDSGDSDSDTNEVGKQAIEEANGPKLKRKRMGPDGLPLASRNARRKKIKRRLVREGIIPRPVKPANKARAQALHAAATASPFNPQGGPVEGHHQQGETQPADPITEHFMATGHVHFESDDDHGMEERPGADTSAASPFREAGVPPFVTQIATESADVSPAGDHDETPSASMSHPSLPRNAAEFEALARIEGMPNCGATVAYKLLEIDASFSPQISPWRSGLVTGVDAAASSVTIVPWPDFRLHPATGCRLASGIDDDVEDEDDGPPSSYDERGILNTHISALADLRNILIELPEPPTHLGATPVAQAEAQTAAMPPNEMAAAARGAQEAAAAQEGATGVHIEENHSAAGATRGDIDQQTADPKPNGLTAARTPKSIVPRIMQIQRATPSSATPVPSPPTAVPSETPSQTQITPKGVVKPVHAPAGVRQSLQGGMRLTPGGPPARVAHRSPSQWQSAAQGLQKARARFASGMANDQQVQAPASKKAAEDAKGASSGQAPLSKDGGMLEGQKGKQVSESSSGSGQNGIGTGSPHPYLGPTAPVEEAIENGDTDNGASGSKGDIVSAPAQPDIINGDAVNGASAALHHGNGNNRIQADEEGKQVVSKSMLPGAVKPRPGVRANSVGAFLARMREAG